jgi:hypothetical protein
LAAEPKGHKINILNKKAFLLRLTNFYIAQQHKVGRDAQSV